MLGLYLSIVETETDKGKVEIIYDKYKKLMYYVAYRVTGDKELAEDAVHESFLKIINNIHRIDEPESDRTKSFICVITRNTALNMLRKQSRETPIGLDISRVGTESKYAEVDTLSELASVIMRLPEGQRDVLRLKVEYGMSNREISQILSVSYDTVRARLSRARKLLKEYLKG